MKLQRLLAMLLVILAVTVPGTLLAQVTVSGKVIDSKTSLPLAGATIKVKNDKATAVSDENGLFTIKAPSSESIISITYVGYGVFETKAGDGNLEVKMENLGSDLNEVIVVGYGNQKKAHLTGAVTSIKGTEIEDLPVGNLGAALTGRLLGVSVNGGTSRPGTAATLVIRNPASLSKDGGVNGPLYVIDGVIQVDGQNLPSTALFNALDPSEVESITILKDAAAAVYGSRGSNGVVLVTTRRGLNGKPRISYSGSYATNDEVYRTKMMSAYELGRYINIMNGPNGNDDPPDPPDDLFTPDELEHFKTVNYDWLDMAWKASYNTRHTLSVSGGTDKTSYFASGSYYTQDGNLGRLKYDKWTYRSGVDVTVASGFKVGLQVSGNQQKSSRMNSEIGGENVENDYRNLLRAPRYVPPYIAGRPVQLPYSGSNQNNVGNYHFFELNKLNNYIDNEGTTLSINAFAEYEAPFLKGLKARVTYARNSTNDRSARIGTRYMLWRFNTLGDNGHIYDGATISDSVTVSNDNRIRLGNTRNNLSQANFTLTYSKTFGQHSISALASVERSEAYSFFEEVRRDNPSQFTNGQLNTAFGDLDGDSRAYEGGNLGYIARVNYSYANKYLGEFLFRTDASTKFAPENYWGDFYSLSAGWVISQENFFKARWVDFLKFRYSIGLLGKDDTKAWLWRQRYTFQQGKGGVYGNDQTAAGVGMKMEASPNRDATWSDDLKQNWGVDARFLRNRLSATIEVFFNKGTGLLIERTANVPVTVGGSIAAQNWGKINFFGYEVALGWQDNIGKDFTYGIDTRFSWNDNKVLQGNFNAIEVLYPWTAKPGQSADNGKWGYDYLGMFRDQAEIDAYIDKYNITQMFDVDASDFRPGMLYYRDVRGPMNADGTFEGPDGVIDEWDQIRLSKKAANHYSFGTTLRASWKGIGFDCVIAGAFGGWSEIDARSPLEPEINNLNRSGVAYWADVYDPVLNPTGKYPNPYWEDVSLAPVSNFWKVSAFRMRIVNANLNYSLPKSLLNRLKITNARFILTVLNPLNLVNPFSYKDPESGWDNYPVLRTFSFGVNVTL